MHGSNKTCIFANEQQCETVIAVKQAVASFSFIGCLFMIFIIWLFKKYTIFTQRLILYLSIAALLDSITYLMGGYSLPGPWCTFQGFFMSVMDWALLCWVCCITFNLFVIVMEKRTEKYEKVFHAVCWGLPVIISLLPFIDNDYGPAGVWCWVKHWGWRFGIWYLPLFVILAILFAAYIYIFVMVRRKSMTYEGTYDPDVDNSKKRMQEEVKPLMAYPCVFLLVSIFPLAHRIHNAVYPYDPPLYWLTLMHVITASMQGALNALIFGIDKETWSKMTPSQIKVAFLSHSKKYQATIREYPVAAPQPLPINTTEDDPPLFDKEE